MQFKTFCAANSGDGFISFFDTLTNEKKYAVYYIKGGPGSGKSTLLKQIASRAENAELIYCSGDPFSLDAVVLPDQKAVIMDATAPHSYEPKFPAVGGNIIDLGEGWAPEKLNKDLIIKLMEEKSEIYDSCYALLGSAKKLFISVFSPMYKHLDYHRLTNIGDRILKQYALWEKRENPAKVEKRFLSAISPDGRITLTETIQKFGKRIIVLEDRWMASGLLLSYLDQKLTQNGIDHINSYHPLCGKDQLHHIIIPERNLSVVTKDGLFPIELEEETVARKIVVQNYFSKEYLEDRKNKLAFYKRILRELINGACENLDLARNLHLKIEKEYALGTDFQATEPLKKKLMNKLFADY